MMMDDDGDGPPMGSQGSANDSARQSTITDGGGDTGGDG